jgi:site-specific recombinase XerD
MSSFAHGRWSRIARRFWRTRQDKKARAIVGQLYRFMATRQLSHAELSPEHLDQLLESPFGQPLARRTRYDYRCELLAYLEWLYAKGELSFDPRTLRRGKRQRRPLPELAEQFVATLAVTLRPGTCRCYRTNLRRFCGWLDEQHIGLMQLDREQMSRWLAELRERGLTPATRCHTILQVRAFMRWLEERGLLARPVAQLLRSTDLPKLPRYLPRPLSPAADRELQARLGASSCRYEQGLLLMRRTGLRLGELMALEYDCVRTDAAGHSYLKVPLGKLNNERLVPLADETVALIEKLQGDGGQPRPWLLASPLGKRTYPWLYYRALRQACEGIAIDGRMTSHRLRHTYATTLLSGGMSLVGLMRLLGHLSYQTTLRYAAITQETIGREYFEALGQLEQRYQQQLRQRTHGADNDPRRLLRDVARWLDKHVAHERGQPRLARRLIKRIRRLESELGRLIEAANND